MTEPTNGVEQEGVTPSPEGFVHPTEEQLANSPEFAGARGNEETDVEPEVSEEVQLTYPKFDPPVGE